jgi:polysaccharide export outer membrane protein
MLSSRSFLLCLAPILSLAAIPCCAQNVAAMNHEPPVVADSGPRPDAKPPSPSDFSQFVIGPSDVLRLNVWKNVELSQTVTVTPDGYVSVPLLGDVHVAGMTANEFAQSLSTRLRSYVVSPQVTVSIVDIRSRQVYVLGQVSKPGGFPLVAPLNVLQLIAQAGGLTNYANRKGIVILRPSGNGPQKLSFNYNDVIHGNTKQNITLEPGDTVIIP